MNQITKEHIDDYFHQNKSNYIQLSKSISNNIKGRICHHKVSVLNIIVNLIDINTYLEIGVHNGASMSYVVNQNKGPIDCYGIDLFEKTFGHYKHGDKISQKRALSNIERNNISGSKITLIQGNSTSTDVLNKVNNIELDLLFIDGDHRTSYVRKDFNHYSKLVKKNGIIVFDDYCKKHKDVIKFVDTIDDTFEKIGLIFEKEMIYKKLI